ncbi:SDR family oxidoreductase, partial [Streptomyces sp. DSM 41033]|uniref:SDR family oxidoreductase n=1 Tax=Streptomyces sp. DSM 41033 TaxID=3448655 RepID=UPI00403FD281
ARELAGRGSALTVTGRREPALHKLVDELGPPARALTADLSRLDEADDLMDRAGEVDILVANAGVGIPQDLTMLSDSEIEEAVRVNLLAPTALARAAAISMKRRGRGHIVFISSGAGLIAPPGNGAVYT